MTTKELNAKQEMKARVLRRDYMMIIGIDPGTNTGISIWDKEYKKLATVETLPIHEAMATIYAPLHEVKEEIEFRKSKILVRVEDARKRKWLPKEKSNSEYRGRLMGAGSVKRDCVIWEDFLTDLGVDFEMVAPKPGATKWSEDYFKRLTKYTGPTDSHGRDAAALVFGL